MNLHHRAARFAFDAGYALHWVKLKENKIASRNFDVPAYSVFVKLPDARRGKYIGDILPY